MKKPAFYPVLLVAAILPMFMGGCAAFAWLATQLAPPQTVEAVYKPPAGKTILVFVDDITHQVSYEPLKGELTRLLGKRLRDNKVAAKTVPYEDLQRLAFSTSKFNQLAVSEVGRRLGADIVLYVQIDRFSLKDNPISPIWRGRFGATVRMVDVRKGRLWPRDREQGYPMPDLQIAPTTDPSPTYAARLSSIMAEKMAEAIANLFYDHEIRAEDSWGRSQDGQEEIQ